MRGQSRTNAAKKNGPTVADNRRTPNSGTAGRLTLTAGCADTRASGAHYRFADGSVETATRDRRIFDNRETVCRYALANHPAEPKTRLVAILDGRTNP